MGNVHRRASCDGRRPALPAGSPVLTSLALAKKKGLTEKHGFPRVERTVRFGGEHSTA
jgi:hypothetical protein